MSYSLGQAKWVPGQISFMTTPTGRLPSLQPLIEAGLPIAPYIEHGSYATGQPSIMMYGRDPYRGLGTPSTIPADYHAPRLACEASGGRWISVPSDPPVRCEGGTGQAVEDAITGTIRATLSPAIMIGTGAVAGTAGGIVGGLFGKAFLGALVGAVGGGALGYLGWRMLPRRSIPVPTPTLSGIIAVL